MTETPFAPFDAEGGLILAVRLPGGADAFGAARRGWSDLAAPDAGPPVWVHLDRTRERAQRWLRHDSGIDPIAAESLLAEETRPRAQAFGTGLLVILRGVNLNPGAQPDDLITIRLWLEPTRIVTLRQFRFRTTALLREQAQAGAAPDAPGAFLAAIAEGLATRLADSLDNLEEMLDRIESAMLERESDDAGWRGTLALIRRQSITYRRYLVPQRETLFALSTHATPLLEERDRVRLRIVGEQIARILDGLEEVRDRAAVTQEELRARHEARVGRTVYLLTLVATVALPLGLLTGLLGVNVGGIPLADSPAGFAIVCGVMTVVAIAEVALFRRMRWL